MTNTPASPAYDASPASPASPAQEATVTDIAATIAGLEIALSPSSSDAMRIAVMERALAHLRRAAAIAPPKEGADKPMRYEPTTWPCCGAPRNPTMHHMCPLMAEWEHFVAFVTERRKGE